MKLHDRWELDPAREKKPFRIGISLPLDKATWRGWWRKAKTFFGERKK